eukprot:5528425-Karenia_brevis.AAC.1
MGVRASDSPPVSSSCLVCKCVDIYHVANPWRTSSNLSMGECLRPRAFQLEESSGLFTTSARLRPQG